MPLTYKGEIYRDDLLNRFTSHTFDTPTTVGSKTRIVFRDGGSVLIDEATKLEVDDAYKAIRLRLVGTFDEVMPRLTVAQRDALTAPDDALQFFETDADEVQIHYQGLFETVGAGEWKVRTATTVQTTDATQTTIDSFTIDDLETYMVRIHVVCTESTAAQRGSFIKTATVYRSGGGAVVEGAVSSQHDVSSVVQYDATITVSGNEVRASVTGFGTDILNWKCSMQFIEQ
jgi:hypothetical protein